MYHLLQTYPYFRALRPWSFSASLTPVLIGAILGYKTSGLISIPILLATIVTVVAVHAAGNVVNTYYDFMSGIDQPGERTEDRTLVDHLLTTDEMVKLGCALYIIGCVGK